MKGIGIDLCGIDRIETAITRNERFLERWYTQEEQAYIISRGKAGAQSAAAMFAAKEAFLKAVGTGIAMGNAKEEVKAFADVICESVENDGIYYCCKNMGLI